MKELDFNNLLIMMGSMELSRSSVGTNDYLELIKLSQSTQLTCLRGQLLSDNAFLPIDLACFFNKFQHY